METIEKQEFIRRINNLNENEEFRIYFEYEEDGSREEEIIALWESISKQDNLYLSGLTNENEYVKYLLRI